MPPELTSAAAYGCSSTGVRRALPTGLDGGLVRRNRRDPSGHGGSAGVSHRPRRDRPLRRTNREGAFQWLRQDIDSTVARARQMLFVCGVVGWRGRAIVIPGRSYAGKSTLVAELVGVARCTTPTSLRSDETGRVHPYRRTPVFRATNGGRKISVWCGGRDRALPIGLIVEGPTGRESPGVRPLSAVPSRVASHRWDDPRAPRDCKDATNRGSHRATVVTLRAAVRGDGGRTNPRPRGRCVGEPAFAAENGLGDLTTDLSRVADLRL